MDASQDLSRRERQIMEVVYARGDAGATAEEVVEGLTDPPKNVSITRRRAPFPTCSGCFVGRYTNARPRLSCSRPANTLGSCALHDGIPSMAVAPDRGGGPAPRK